MPEWTFETIVERFSYRPSPFLKSIMISYTKRGDCAEHCHSIRIDDWFTSSHCLHHFKTNKALNVENEKAL